MTAVFWATNLKYLRKRKKMSQDDVAARLNITRAKWTSHENGTTKNPTVDDLVHFSKFFSISIDSLLRVDLSRLSELKFRELEAGNDIYATGTQIRVLATTVDPGNNDNIELVPVKAKAGYTSGYGDPDFISQLPVFHLPHLPKDRKYRMFPTTGDSMHPVPEGAFIVGEYVEDWKNIKAGTPCIVITGTEGIVFKLVQHTALQEQSLLLQSLNSNYPPYEVPVSDILEIWRFRSLISDQLPEAETTLNQMARDLHQLKTDINLLIRK